MSLTSKVLMAAATAYAGHELQRLLSGLEVDTLLQPLGLTRRRSHLGESLLFLSAGIAVGAAATVFLTPSKRKSLAAWVSSVTKKSVEGVVEDVRERGTRKKQKRWDGRDTDPEIRIPEQSDAVL